MIGIDSLSSEYDNDFIDINVSDGGLFKVGQDGVNRIVTPLDKKVEFIG